MGSATGRPRPGQRAARSDLQMSRPIVYSTTSKTSRSPAWATVLKDSTPPAYPNSTRHRNARAQGLMPRRLQLFTAAAVVGPVVTASALLHPDKVACEAATVIWNRLGVRMVACAHPLASTWTSIPALLAIASLVALARTTALFRRRAEARPAAAARAHHPRAAGDAGASREPPGLRNPERTSGRVLLRVPAPTRRFHLRARRFARGNSLRRSGTRHNTHVNTSQPARFLDASARARSPATHPPRPARPPHARP